VVVDVAEWAAVVVVAGAAVVVVEPDTGARSAPTTTTTPDPTTLATGTADVSGFTAVAGRCRVVAMDWAAALKTGAA
jgi:hypothetical protein